MSNTGIKTELHEVGEANGKLHGDKSRPGWVKFDEETPSKPSADESLQETSTAAVVASTSAQSSPQLLPAVLNTETVQINFDRGDKNVEVSQNTLSKNVEFVTIRQGFCKYQLYANYSNTTLPV